MYITTNIKHLASKISSEMAEYYRTGYDMASTQIQSTTNQIKSERG